MTHSGTTTTTVLCVDVLPGHGAGGVDPTDLVARFGGEVLDTGDDSQP